MSKKTISKLEENLKKGTVICAEGYLFELERRGYLQAGPFVPEVVLDNPEVVEQLHREFVRAGSDVVVAFTYYAHREKLKSIGRDESVEELNKKALEIAKKVADETGTILSGDICNTWVYDPKNLPESAEEVRSQYREQVKWAKEAGVDFILAETIDYFGEAKIALEVCQEFDLPVVLNLSSFHNKTRDGVLLEDALIQLYDLGALVVGLNCFKGPATILPPLENLRKKGFEGYLSCLPVPYQTNQKCACFQHLKRKDGKSSYTVDLDEHLVGRYEVEIFGKKCQEIGINFVGLCCGNAPHYTRTLAESYGRVTEASKCSPNLSAHPVFGKKAKLKDVGKSGIKQEF